MEPALLTPKAVFDHAHELPSPAERQAYLDQACADDAELRAKVEALLRAYDDAGSFLESPPPGSGGTAEHRPAEGPGSRIGPYKLLQEIGEGGMGVVFMAEQEKPVRRRVALKIIKPGMDSAQVVARFEAERQALAMMDHQNIARVLDAGTTDSGRPYFVMELVHGVPITKYCDDNHLTPKERLELFVPVCQAIQHAHQKGVIHRDVKPSNVMVCLYDGKPVPKVIDFGVAKAVEQRLTERTMFTNYGTIIGTFEYMAPEQAEMSQLGVDTRSDIYSLGVLLYELLTGTTPLSRARVRAAALDEVLRLIREEEPPKPSTRITQSKESLAGLAAARRTEPAKLSRLMRGELDWIVMKALEKDRARRYDTANGLARDVQCYLADETVEACPPSASYKLRKFARKHRAALATAAAFAALLLSGTAVSTWQAVRAMQAREAALAARDAEAAERQAAVQSAAEARAVLQFFQDKVLAATRPQGQEGGLGREATIRAAVDAAEPKIGAAFADQPAVEAAVRSTLGATYRYLGESALAIRQHERARALRRQALGPDHPDTLQSMNDLALAYRDAGRLPEALSLFEETLKLRRAKLGPDHPDTLQSMNDLARTYFDSGRRPESFALHEETLKLRRAKLGPDHPGTLESMSNLGMTYWEAGRLPEAIALNEEALKLKRAKLGPDHPDTLSSMNNLALTYRDADRPAEALPMFEEALKLMRAGLGPEHPETLNTVHNLALTYEDMGRLAEALALFEENLQRRKAKLGPDHPDTLLSRSVLAGAYRDSSRLADALALYEENLKLLTAKLGADHPLTLSEMRGFAGIYLDLGNYTRAEALLLEVLALSKPKLGTDHPEVIGTQSWLGLTYLKQKKFAEAEPILRECRTILQKTSPNSVRLFNTQSQLGGSLLGQAKYAAAEPLLLTGYEGLKQHEAQIPAGYKVRLTEALERLVQLYEATGRPEKAAEYRAKLPPKDGK